MNIFKNYLRASILLFALLWTISVQAQRTSSRIVAGMDLGTGLKEKNYLASLNYFQFLKIDKTGFLQVGWGARFAQFGGRDLNLTTAAAQFAKNANSTDTLQMDRATLSSVNFNLGVQISILEKIDIGANTDIFGFAFGGRRTGYHLGSAGFNKADSLNIHKTYQTARPTSTGLQLVGDNVRGNLNSEIYARVRFTPRFGLKVGYLFAVNEYRTNIGLVEGNRRFRARTQMLYVGLTIPIDN